MLYSNNGPGEEAPLNVSCVTSTLGLLLNLYLLKVSKNSGGLGSIASHRVQRDGTPELVTTPYFSGITANSLYASFTYISIVAQLWTLTLSKVSGVNDCMCYTEEYSSCAEMICAEMICVYVSYTPEFLINPFQLMGEQAFRCAAGLSDTPASI